MSKFAVVDGDKVMFDASSFLPVVVAVQPGTISGTGKKLTSGTKVCVKGDEGHVEVPGVSYTTPAFTDPGGNGTLRIDSLGSDQTAQKLTVGQTAVILVGTTFKATFTVDTPATNASAGTSDVKNTVYKGTGSFVTSNTKLDSA